MSAKDTLVMLFERGNAMQTFWGFYITVAGALLAFFGSARRPRLLAAVLSVAFIAFAYVNAAGLRRIAKQNEALYAVFTSQLSRSTADDWMPTAPSSAKRQLHSAAEPLDALETTIFHATSDMLVLSAIWLLTLLPREAASQRTRPAA